VLPIVDSLSIGGGQLLADSRTIFDSIAIPGTDQLYFTYDSSRASGFQSTLVIKLLSESIPEQLRLVHLIIVVAGVQSERMLVAKPNLTYTFGWDKRNAYAQTVYGLTNAKGL
jgi:hypothetical protein